MGCGCQLWARARAGARKTVRGAPVKGGRLLIYLPEDLEGDGMWFLYGIVGWITLVAHFGLYMV